MDDTVTIQRLWILKCQIEQMIISHQTAKKYIQEMEEKDKYSRRKTYFVLFILKNEDILPFD